MSSITRIKHEGLEFLWLYSLRDFLPYLYLHDTVKQREDTDRDTDQFYPFC